VVATAPWWGGTGVHAHAFEQRLSALLNASVLVIGMNFIIMSGWLRCFDPAGRSGGFLLCPLLQHQATT
jgi:hypothetical protein